MKRSPFILGLVLATLLLSARGEVYAQGFILITVDENGHGSLVNPSTGTFNLPGVLAPDPGPGGLASALSYNLLGPPSLVVGDVLLMEPGGGGLISELIRFNPDHGGTLVFYSDNLDGVDSLADTGFPSSLYTNLLTISEVGPEGSNGALYTPTAGQPGFVSGSNFPVQYRIISDAAAVPEPGTLLTGGIAIALGAGYTWLRRRRSIDAYTSRGHE